MKILCLFDYASADRSWERWNNQQKRESPEHHLWGVTHLEQYGIDVELLPYEKFGFLRTIGEKLKLGDLDQQMRVLLCAHRYDLIYSTCQTSTLILALFRLLGILQTPIVVKLERPFKEHVLNRILLHFFAKGHDKLLCLSHRTYNQLRDTFGIPESKLALLDWGPHLPAYDDYQFPTNGTNQDTPLIISAGNMSRDYNTPVQAFCELEHKRDCELQIYCAKSSAPTVDVIPSNVKFLFRQQENLALAWKALMWEDLLAKYANAYAIAIPLLIPPHRADCTPLYGLTSLLDAMAMEKPVIMTRHKQANIDVEREGIGLWVEPGDVEGWQKAVIYLLDHPEESRMMGKRARTLAEEKYNLDIFSAQLAAALKSVKLK